MGIIRKLDEKGDTISEVEIDTSVSEVKKKRNTRQKVAVNDNSEETIENTSAD